MIRVKKTVQLELLDEANRIVHRVLDGLAERIVPGATTRELDRWAESTLRAAGATPAFLGYRGFPATLCTALNDVVVHGIPDDRPLVEGDILGIDCGVCFQGYYGDAARTYAVGRITEASARLLRITREALELAIAKIQAGGRLSDLGHAIQRHVEDAGCAVVREFVGHGVGAALHEDPKVLNYGEPGRGPRLRPGMVLAVEPMVTLGAAKVTVDRDGWTARTCDGSLSAHFECSIALTESGPWVLGMTDGRPGAAPEVAWETRVN